MRKLNVDTTHMTTKVTPLCATNHKTPSVYIDPKIKHKMDYIVKKCEKEVGWFFLVKKINEHTYLLHDILLPKQEVHGTETDISEETMADLTSQLLEQGLDPGEAYAWFHSHVDMDVRPSAQDELEVESFLETIPLFIRGIVNKKGAAKIDVYDVEKGVAFNNVPFLLNIEQLAAEEMAELDTLIKDNVKEVATVFQGFQQGALYDDEAYTYSPGKKGGPHNRNTTRPSNQTVPKLPDPKGTASAGPGNSSEDLSKTDSENRLDIDQLVFLDTGFGEVWTEDQDIEERPQNWFLDTEYYEKGFDFDHCLQPHSAVGYMVQEIADAYNGANQVHIES